VGPGTYTAIFAARCLIERLSHRKVEKLAARTTGRKLSANLPPIEACGAGMIAIRGSIRQKNIIARHE